MSQQVSDIVTGRARLAVLVNLIVAVLLVVVGVVVMLLPVEFAGASQWWVRLLGDSGVLAIGAARIVYVMGG